ncbi:MAG: hypothetical protein AAFR76_03400 [Planctomycetota bacterium]
MTTATTHLLPTNNTGDVRGFGRFTTDNPAELIRAADTSERLVAWAGWLDDAKADPSQGRFDPDFHAWSPAGWQALRDGIAAAIPSLRTHDATLCLRPHAGCVLSDPQGCLNFLRDDPPERVELLLDPVAMLTPMMMDKVEDHLARAFEALGDQPAAIGCVLAAAVETDGRVAHAPLVDYAEFAQLITGLWKASPLADRPVLVTDPRDASA